MIERLRLNIGEAVTVCREQLRFEYHLNGLNPDRSKDIGIKVRAEKSLFNSLLDVSNYRLPDVLVAMVHPGLPCLAVILLQIKQQRWVHALHDLAHARINLHELVKCILRYGGDAIKADPVLTKVSVCHLSDNLILIDEVLIQCFLGNGEVSGNVIHGHTAHTILEKELLGSSQKFFSDMDLIFH